MHARMRACVDGKVGSRHGWMDGWMGGWIYFFAHLSIQRHGGESFDSPGRLGQTKPFQCLQLTLNATPLYQKIADGGG
jgi:hypothetical protein